MKTIPWITLGLLAAAPFAIAQEGKEKPDRPHRELPEAVVKEFDKDGDGKLSPEERAEMREALKTRREENVAKFDKDGDGKLSPEEREEMRKAKRAEIIAKYDKDGDGKLNEEERAEARKEDPDFGRRGPGAKGEEGGRPPGPPPAAPKD